MPQVPRYDSFQVDPAPLPSGEQNVQLRPDAFGAGISEGLAVGAQKMHEYAEAERLRADEISLLEAERKFQDWELSSVEAALNMRGKDAIAVPEQFFPDMDRAVSEIAQSIPSDRARQKFQERVLGKQRSISLTINRHVRSEIEQHDAAETQALITNSQRAAAMNYNDPARIAEEIDLQHDAILARAARIGADKEVIDQLTASATSATHAGVIDRMVSTQQYAAAREYLAANSEDLLPEQRSAAERVVREAGIRVDSQEAADRIMGQYDNRTAALEAARAIDNPEVRDATVQRINQRFNEEKAAEEENKAARLEDASRLVQDAGGDMAAIPPDMYSQLTAAEIGNLKALGNYMRTGIPAQDDARWYALEQMAMNEPEKFAKANLMVEARPYTDDARFNRLVSMQGQVIAAARGDKDATANLTNTRTFSQTFEDMARLTGIGPTSKPLSQWNKSQREEYIEFMGIAQGELAAEELKLGRKLIPAEQRALIADVLSRRVSLDRDMWTDRKNVPYYELSGEDLANAYVPYDEIPQGWRQALTNTLLAEVYGGRTMQSLSWSEQADVKRRVGKVWALDRIGAAELDPDDYGMPPRRPWREE